MQNKKEIFVTCIPDTNNHNVRFCEYASCSVAVFEYCQLTKVVACTHRLLK